MDATAAQFGDRVLRRLGLLLARRADERHEGHVEVADVVAAGFLAELTDRLEERKDLDVADGAADLGDDHVDVVGGQAMDAALDLVGDVRDHLHGLAEIVATALGSEHRLVDRSGCGVGVAGQRLVDEPLVVTEIEVGLAAVVGDEHLAVLEGVHRAGVDVDVWVELLHRDPQAAQLQQAAERRRGETFAEGAGNASSHENVLRHWTKTSVSGELTTGLQHTAPRPTRVDPDRIHSASAYPGQVDAPRDAVVGVRRERGEQHRADSRKHSPAVGSRIVADHHDFIRRKSQRVRTLHRRSSDRVSPRQPRRTA